MTTIRTTAPPSSRAGRAGAARPRRSGLARARTATGATFLAPNLVLVGVFLLLPLGWAVWLSLQALGSLGAGRWAGWNNYLDLARDGVFWHTLLTTVVFTAITVPAAMVLGLAIAVLLDGVLPGRAVYRSIIFLPLVISGVATGVLGQWMFDQDHGFVDEVLTAVHLPAPDWQSSGPWALTSIILVTLWQRVGFAMLIYLAGLQGVDPQLLEAATVDGASAWQRFRRITLPLLGPSTFFLLVMNVIYSFQVFDTVWAMTRGGPDYSTTTVVTYAYRTAFDEHGPQQLGYGAAVGVVICVLTLVITAVQWRASRHRDQVS